MILRDMTEADLDVLFEIQDDDIARHMAAFTSADGGDRDRYVARFRRLLADDKIINKVILVDDEIVGSIASFMLEGDTEVTSWIRRDRWGRGIATAALAELLRQVTVRPSSRGSRPTTPARRRCCSATGSRGWRGDVLRSRPHRGDHGALYRLDEPASAG